MATKVLILAAGRGSRLGPRTAELPKPLLQVGPRSLIEHQLEAYAEAGVGPVAMVVGYQADDVIESVGLKCEYFLNHRWAVTNSLYSFLLAREWANDDLIIANCDILFHPGILSGLIASGGDAFAYDSESGHGLEHMKVQLAGGALVKMSKTLEADQVSGENVGLIFLKADSAQALVSIAQRLVSEGHAKDWLGLAVQELARERPLRGVDIAGLPWAEVDFAYDLDRARKQVWPAIRRRDRRRKGPVAKIVAAAAVVLALTSGFSAFSHAPDADVPEWTTLHLGGTGVLTLSDGGREQRWWVLGPGEFVEMETIDTGDLRIESRVVLPPGTDRLPYRLDIIVDEGTRWAQHDGVASGMVRHENSLVSAPRYDLVPVGSSPVRVRLQASTSAEVPVLVRFRQLEQTLCDDPAGFIDAAHDIVKASSGPDVTSRSRSRARPSHCAIKL
jgi:L-glutamine-phosphate cytidylyltransferase